MKRICSLWVLLLALPCSAETGSEAPPSFWPRLHQAIQRHMGRPYVWGAVGLKSFDCSGFVWRSLADSGYLLKRTTARKLYFSLREVDSKLSRTPGNLVFFDDLGHVGIVQDKQTFFHSATSKGTSQGSFPGHWERLVTGYRTLEGLEVAPPKPPKKTED